MPDDFCKVYLIYNAYYFSFGNSKTWARVQQVQVQPLHPFPKMQTQTGFPAGIP